jgi:hypothetical protein
VGQKLGHGNFSYLDAVKNVTPNAMRTWVRAPAQSGDCDKFQEGYSEQGHRMNPSDRIDQLIAKTTDWRGKTLASVRKAILEANREIVEEWKWMGSPVWSLEGIIVVGNAHKEKVKLTFSHGASLPDPDKLFNAGFGGKVWRSIDFLEDDKVNARALKNLVRAAIDFNRAKAEKKKKAPAAKRAKIAKSKKT